MIDLSKFFSNPFLDGRFSFGDQQRFSEEHIGRLSAQNTGVRYDIQFNSIVLAHNDYFGDFTNVKIKEVVQQSLTEVVDKIIADFKERTSKLNSFLVANGTNKLTIYPNVSL